MKDLPRIGFVGLGNIGRDRLRLLQEEGRATAAALFDPDPGSRDDALRVAPDATATDALHTLLDLDLDGVVISSPNHFHCDQALTFLEAGIPVFCQKPLGRSASETERILESADAAGLPFGVDLPYRHARGLQRAKEALAGDEIGQVFGMDLTFHNGYGPQQPWFYDVRRSGGGCLLDLGVHLLDLGVWLSGSCTPQLRDVALWREGRRLTGDAAAQDAEDFATLLLDLGQTRGRLACSWGASLGQEARFELTITGTRGAIRVFNADGSFYHLQTEVHRGTRVLETLKEDTHWRGRALHRWIKDIRDGAPFDAQSHHLSQVLATIHHAREALWSGTDAEAGSGRVSGSGTIAATDGATDTARPDELDGRTDPAVDEVMS